jgi:hypothetical protein
MDQLFQDFSILGLAALAVMIVVAVGMTRKVLTFFFPVLVPVRTIGADKLTYKSTYLNKWARFYNELFLYALPYVWAALLALVKSEFIYGKIATYGGRLFMAFFIATFSATIFKAVKKSIPKSFGTEVATSDNVFESLPEDKPSGGGGEG